ncbi:MAG: ankyrin repeat domain-containing protein [Leptospiraceae bacterium]|nr:ankyrin repeat domain-containing protein [Leptospiraceae bacterium]
MKYYLIIAILILNQSFIFAETKVESQNFLEAATKGDFALIESELKKGFDINTSDENGNTALHIAALKANLELTKFLLQKGANLNQKDGNGDSPLANAAAVGSLEVVKLLIEKGSEVDSKNQTGWTPLRWASNEGYLPIVNFLIEKGAEIYPLYMADRYFLEEAKNGNLDGMQKYLNKGASINAVDEDGISALLYVTSNLSLNNSEKYKTDVFESVKFLVENGGDLNEKSPTGFTPLLYSMHNNHIPLIQYLISQNASLADVDSNGDTCLILASRIGNLKLAQFFLEKKADTNLKNYSGETALHASSKTGQLEIVKTLLNLGADIDSEDNNKFTPLLVAARAGHESVVKLLLSSGANINHKEERNYSALMLAAENGHLTTVKILTEAGADKTIKSTYYPYGDVIAIAKKKSQTKVVEYLESTNLNSLNKSNSLSKTDLNDLLKVFSLLNEQIKGRNKDGFTALHWACKNENLELVKFVILPENLNQKDKQGFTPLHYSIKSGNLEITKFLIEKGADKNTKNNNGKTPIDIAPKKSKPTLIKILNTTKLIPLQKSTKNIKSESNSNDSFNLEDDAEEEKNSDDSEE